MHYVVEMEILRIFEENFFLFLYGTYGQTTLQAVKL